MIKKPTYLLQQQQNRWVFTYKKGIGTPPDASVHFQSVRS